MNTPVVLHIGVDVAKDEVVVACEEEAFAPRVLPNERRAILGWLKTLPAGSCIGMESTGRYHRLLAGLAFELGLVVYVLNPRDCWHYAKGVGLREYATVDGLRAADIVLDKVQVGTDALLGTADAASPAIERAVDRAVAALCAEAVGIMETLNAMTLDYIKTRKQFGVAIGSFQVLQHRMVDMTIAAEQAKSLEILAAMSVDGENANERRRAVSAAKVQSGLSGRTVGQGAIQLHGGIGMTDEYAAGHYFKRLTTIEHSFGDTDYHLDRFPAF